MVQVGLDFNLSSKLFFNFGLFKFGLVDDFEGDDEAGALLTGQVDMAEFALTKWTTDFKIFQTPGTDATILIVREAKGLVYFCVGQSSFSLSLAVVFMAGERPTPLKIFLLYFTAILLLWACFRNLD